MKKKKSLHKSGIPYACICGEKITQGAICKRGLKEIERRIREKEKIT